MKSSKEKEKLIEQLKKTPIVQIACEKVGVGRASYYRWRKENPEFAKQTDEAIAEGLLLINDMAESQLISAIRDKNMTGIIFWLKHRHKSYGTRIELSGQLEHSGEILTPEQEALVREALKLSSLNRLDKPRYE